MTATSLVLESTCNKIRLIRVALVLSIFADVVGRQVRESCRHMWTAVAKEGADPTHHRSRWVFIRLTTAVLPDVLSCPTYLRTLASVAL